MKKNTARIDEPIWDSRNSDEPEMTPRPPRPQKIRDENHLAWWEYLIGFLMMPVALVAWLVIIALFIGVAIPVGIIGAGISWLMKVGR